jgi:hypothetical protein
VSNNGAISPANVQKVAPQLEAMGVKWDGGDGLTFPDGNRVDFIRGMKAGNGTGQLNWLDSTMQGGPGWVGKSPSPTMTAPTLGGGTPSAPSAGDDFWQKIIAAIQGGVGRNEGGLTPAQIAQLLQGSGQNLMSSPGGPQ